MHKNANAGLALLCILLSSGLLISAGCSTPIGSLSRQQPQPKPLSREKADFAQALALYSQGLVLQMRGQYSSALTNYLEAIEHDPDNDELYLRVAMGYLRKRKPERAIAVMESLCERKPQAEKPYLWLAFMLRADGKTDEAVEIYKKIIEMKPTSHKAYLELASIYARKDRTDDAITLLKEANQRVTDPLDLLRLLGDLYVRRGQATTDRSAADRYRQEAIETYEEAVSQAPDDVTLLFQLADLYILNEQLEEAISRFQRIEQLQPGNLQLKRRLAMSLIANGEEEEAIAVLEQIVDEEPTNAHVYYYLGELYQELDETENALLNFRLATRADPAEPAAFLRLALLQMEDNPTEAAATLEESLERFPDNLKLLEALAYLHLNEEHYEKALVHFSRAEIAMERRADMEVTPVFYFNYAVAAQHTGQIDDAAQLLLKAIDENPAFLEAYLQQVLEYSEESALTNAAGVLHRLADKLPQERTVRIYEGLVYNISGLYEKAFTAFEQADATPPDALGADRDIDATFFFWYGAAAERLGKIEKASELFLKCLDIEEEHAEAHNYLAYMWAEKGIRLDEALDHIDRALELKPDSGAFIDTLGWIYYMQGHYAKALETIKKAHSLLPDDPTITEHLGDILMKLEWPEEAARYWQDALELDPDNEDLRTKMLEHGITPQNREDNEPAGPDSPVEDHAVPTADSVTSETNTPPPATP